MQSLVDFILTFLKLAIWGSLGDDYSVWTVLLLWALRIVSLSLLFRQYVGPSVIRLVSRRLRVRSVSLRSIRGIYFRAGSKIWRVERVGISFNRLFSSQFSRVYVKVEGLQLELSDDEEETSNPKPGAAPHDHRPIARSSLLGRRLWMVVYSCSRRICRMAEPTVRPLIRSSFVATLRVIIKALPALTHVVEFELNSARLTHSAIPGTTIEIKKATISSKISLSQVDSSLRTDTPASETRSHRRRFSVADLNARLSSSLRRAWDRAWGATRFAASMSLAVEDVLGNAQCIAREGLPDPFDGKHAFLYLSQRD